MSIPTRFLAALAIGLGLGLITNAQTGTPEKKVRPELAAVLQLADNLERPDVSRQAKKVGDELGSCAHLISRVFDLKVKGGAGIGSAVEAGHQDSIEGLIQNWSGPRPPTRDELQTHQKDLLQVARVVQAMAEVAPYRVNHFNPRSPGIDLDPAEFKDRFLKVSAEFKTTAGEFRKVIESSEPTAVHKAAVNLQRSCNACHKGFAFR